MENIKRIISTHFGYDTNKIQLTPVMSSTNDTYIIKIGKKNAYIAKKCRCKIEHFVANNIHKEHEIIKRIAPFIRVPQIVYFSQQYDILILNYNEGVEFDHSHFNSIDIVPKIVECVKEIHSLPEIEYNFSPYEDIRQMINLIRINHIYVPFSLSKHLTKVGEIEKERQEYDNRFRCFCHNDLNSRNFLVCNNNILIIDWGSAGMGDLFFDLAVLSEGYSKEMKLYLLKCYFGEISPIFIRSLESMDYVVRLYIALWAILKHTTDNRRDFIGISNYYFNTITHQGLSEQVERLLNKIGRKLFAMI